MTRSPAFRLEPAACTLMGAWLRRFGGYSAGRGLEALRACKSWDDAVAVSSVLDDGDLVLALLRQSTGDDLMRRWASLLIGRRSWQGWLQWSREQRLRIVGRGLVERIAFGEFDGLRVPPRVSASTVDTVARATAWAADAATPFVAESLTVPFRERNSDAVSLGGKGAREFEMRVARFATRCIEGALATAANELAPVRDRHIAVVRVQHWMGPEHLPVVVNAVASCDQESHPWLLRALLDSRAIRTVSARRLRALAQSAGLAIRTVQARVWASPSSWVPAALRCFVHEVSQLAMFAELETTVGGDFHPITIGERRGYVLRSGHLWEFLAPING